MSGYALLKSLIVPSASVAWAHEYQMTSPSFFAAGRLLLFHSAMAGWYFAADAGVSPGAAEPDAPALCLRGRRVLPLPLAHGGLILRRRRGRVHRRGGLLLG